MRVAALYDVHGNLPALEAVLADAEDERADLVVGGDLVSGPLGRECLELLLELREPVRFVRGNADRWVLELAAGTAEPEHHSDWVLGTLEVRHLEAIAAFEPTVAVDVKGLGPTLFCHATPRNDTEFFLETTPDEIAAPMLGDVSERTVVCGHTHMQFDRTVTGWRVVNAGSVGMPYEAEPGGYWALLGPGVELRRTAYDLERAAEGIRRSGHPEADEFVRENVLTVPSREEALAVFEPLVGGA